MDDGFVLAALQSYLSFGYETCIAVYELHAHKVIHMNGEGLL